MEHEKCFRDLQNYTTLKQTMLKADSIIGFRDLQNYTTLKRKIDAILRHHRFRDLQNYTTLKQCLVGRSRM